MANASAETPRNADSPFDPASYTPDVILRSSDNVDFYVMKTFLAFSSPDVFAAMFTLPQSQQDISSPGGLHIVPVAEDNKVLRILLLHCYPLDSQGEANDIVDIARAMSAARKYAMDFAEKRIEKMFLSMALSLLDENPLHIFALACRYGFDELSRAAVKKTLETPLHELPPSPELKYISGMDMYQLTQVRHRFLKNLWKWYFLSGTEHIFGMDDDEYTGVFEVSYIWFESQNHDPPCSFITTNITLYDRYQRNCNISAAQWWSTYFVALMKAIEVRPSRETVFKFTEEAYYEALADANSCAICRVHAVRHLDAFREYFARNLDEIVMQTIGELEFRTP